MKTKIINILYAFVKSKPFVSISALVMVASGLYAFFSHANSINTFVSNSTLTNSPIIQNSPLTSVTYQSPDLESLGFSRTMSIQFGPTQKGYGGKDGNFYNIKIFLPDNSEAFLREALFNQTYKIGKCNVSYTKCEIYNEYKFLGNYSNSLCWLATMKVTKLSTGELDLSGGLQKFGNISDASNCFVAL